MLGFRHVAATAGGEFVLSITQSAVRPDIHALAIAAGWNGATRLVVDISAPNINTLDWIGEYPAGRKLIIRSTTRVGAEYNGSFALRINSPIEIENKGEIRSRGSNGGSGGSVWVAYYDDRRIATGGSGDRAEGYEPGTTTWRLPSGRSIGATVSVGPALGGVAMGYGHGGTGGFAGGPGEDGFYGGPATVSGQVTEQTYVPQGRPQAAGIAISGVRHVTWIERGRVAGLLA